MSQIELFRLLLSPIQNFAICMYLNLNFVSVIFCRKPFASHVFCNYYHAEPACFVLSTVIMCIIFDLLLTLDKERLLTS
jgi:hypothetical protein